MIGAGGSGSLLILIMRGNRSKLNRSSDARNIVE